MTGARLLRVVLRLVPVLVLALVWLWPARAQAYAWMLRHGYGGCTTCHTDPSGGELLTAYGRAQGDLLLRMRYGKPTATAPAGAEGGDSFDEFDDFDEGGAAAPEQQPAKASAPAAAPESGPSTGFLWGLVDTPDFLLLGGAYRHLNVYKPSKRDFSTFPMQMDLYAGLHFSDFRAGASVGLGKVEEGSPHVRKAQVTTNQGDQFNVISRTHWLGWDLANAKYTVRAGRINLPFGVRIPEHTMWVREASATDRESDQQHGVALSYNGAWLRAEIMGIAGNYQLNPDKFRERGYSLYAEVLATDWAAVGVSSLLTYAAADLEKIEDRSVVRQAHGVMARLAPADQVAVLVEGDALLRTSRDVGYVGFAQADLEFVQGLHFMLTGEVLDSGFEATPGALKAAGFGKPRFGGWLSVDWFFLPQLELRLDAITRQDDPFTLLAQFHAYL